MATMFGRFEIQSELSKSETAMIYKALDTETNQVVALKTQSLEPLGDRADAFVETLVAEGENTRDLVGQNIVLLYGAGEMDGQFCAAMEYIQGNSIATMLARKEGFSIWDLLDITRQVCAGLEHAASKNVAHHSLEPAKIMVQWDGMVKLLGYGISNMSLIEAEAGKGLGRLMPYCSPEQIRGEAIDLRSNLFTLGSILYEMVVGRKAFDATDPVALVSQIENDTPPSPSSVNVKIQPAVSALIMKALAKDPAERYQSARELLDDLETCKENKKAAADAKKPAAQGPKVTVDAAARAAAASKFVSSSSTAAASTTAPSAPKVVPAAPTAPKPVTPKPVMSAPVASAPPRSQASISETKFSTAAAGVAGGTSSAPKIQRDPSVGSEIGSNYAAKFATKSDSHSYSNSNTSAPEIKDFEIGVPEAQADYAPVLSAAVVEPEPVQDAPQATGDPMMAEVPASPAATSFSDLAEMPPLKDAVYAPSISEPSEPLEQILQINSKKEEKPRVQPREVAEKAMKEIATVPPKLMLFAILGAVGLILVIAMVVFFHVRSEDDGSTAAPRPAKAVTPSPASSQPATPAAEAQAPTPIETLAPPPEDAQPNLKVRQVERRGASNRRAPAPAPVPVVLAGEALIDSTPQGAQFQVDGKSDPSWITPFTVSSLGPGKHIISVSKSGYTSDVRSVDVAANSKSSLVVHLAAMNALVVVNSTPPGAEVIIDGKSTTRVTPAQFAVEKGSHTVLLRKQGYLEETVTADLGPAQNFQYSPVLKALGNTEDMKTVGKFNKLFGHGGDNTAGMGSISIHTQPKGAQIAINQRMLDKLSPVDVMLGPGNYIVDVTLTGFKPVHKIVSIDKGGKVAVDETMERQ
jgi:serine/threonine protein kinase